MEEIDFSSLGNTLNKIALYLGGIMLACTVGFFLVYLLLRLIKVPRQYAKFFGSIAFLVIAYLAFTSGILPDRLSH